MQLHDAFFAIALNRLQSPYEMTSGVRKTLSFPRLRVNQESKIMQTPALGKIIADCWMNAENSVRHAAKRYRDKGEEFITELLNSELEREFQKASDSRFVEKAFLTDLKKAFPLITGESLSNVALGLIATVSFHPKHVEGKTGGDLGLVVVRPHVQMFPFDKHLTIDRDHRRGLLCQAKIFGNKSKWGPLTPKQLELLPGKIDYSSLLLYRYADQRAKRCDLLPFAWQLTRAATIEEIKGWLASGYFPGLSDSRVIFQSLIRDKIGTGDKVVIDRDVAPSGLRDSLVITIRWKDGRDPGDRVSVKHTTTVREKQLVMLRS
jgi:hypothetical protein